MLAEILQRAFASFGAHLEAQETTGDPHRDLHILGRAYLDFAARHPLQYRLMFETAHPATMEKHHKEPHSPHGFVILQDNLRRLRRAEGRTVDQTEIDLDATFVWSAMHGLTAIRRSDAFQSLELGPEVEARSAEHLMNALLKALSQRG